MLNTFITHNHNHPCFFFTRTHRLVFYSQYESRNYCLFWTLWVHSIVDLLSFVAPRVSCITTDSCVIDWVPPKAAGNDVLVYVLQIAFSRDQTFKQVSAHLFVMLIKKWNRSSCRTKSESLLKNMFCGRRQLGAQVAVTGKVRSPMNYFVLWFVTVCFALPVMCWAIR